MRIADINEHLNCFNYELSEKPIIEVERIDKEEKKEFSTINNKVFFILEGKVQFSAENLPDYQGQKGQILFIPAGANYSYKALTTSMLLIFSIQQPMMLCSNLSMEELYKQKKTSQENEHRPHPNWLGVVEINARIWHFLDGITNCISDGLKCRYWFELKVKEFFTFLRVYYPKQEIYEFLYPILSGDTAFSEYIRTNWRCFHSVQEMATSMNMTVKQFSTKFVKIFGKTPYRWMQEERSRIVIREIASTNKLFKQIAIENGFSTDSMFTNFCKKELGATPTELRDEKKQGSNP